MLNLSFQCTGCKSEPTCKSLGSIRRKRENKESQQQTAAETFSMSNFQIYFSDYFPKHFTPFNKSTTCRTISNYSFQFAK